MVHIKSKSDLEKMREAGSATAQILQRLKKVVGPGVSTATINKKAAELCNELNVIPAFKGYHGFPAYLCISVNDVVVHGIPSESTVLKEGDIVGLDFGVIKEGFYGDSAVTVAVGEIDDKFKKLLQVTEESLHCGINQALMGNRLFDISHAIQEHIENSGFSIVREFVGHGIGKALHEDPQVPNFGRRGTGMVLKPGLTIAIEPMVNIGKAEVFIEKDGWTVRTVDGSWSAHFEHTIAITENGPEIFTLAT